MFIHQALDMCLPGDIIVVSNDEDDTHALMGEVMFTYAMYQRKLGALILDGLVRDLDALREIQYLREKNIFVSLRCCTGLGGIRVSFHYYTPEWFIDAFLEAMKEYVALHPELVKN